MVATLRHGGRGGTEEPARRRGRNLLVVAQTAMALILLVGSGLLVRSFANLTGADLGFSPSNVMTFRLTVPQADYPDNAQVIAFQEQLVSRLRETPGVDHAGAVSVLPVISAAPGAAYVFDGRPQAPGELPPMVHYKVITAGYFDTMGVSLLSGRDFNSGDARDDVRTIVVNRALAEQYWPGQDPLGKRLSPATAQPGPINWFTVAGVVGDVRQDGLREPPRPLIYFPVNTQQGLSRAMTFVVRGAGTMPSGDALRRAVWALDGDLPVASMQSMDEIVSASVVQFTFTMLTLGIAAGMALVLGAIGLYGVLSYAVSLRTREIGVRLALGAPPSVVMRSVVANGAAITAVGLVIGVAGAAGLTRFLQGLLYETETLDPLTFAGMSAALFVVALAASYLPARKAAAVSPLESMKAD
jgi:predicted permease